MALLAENASLRERIDSLDTENPCSTASIVDQLRQTLVVLHELREKLDESLRERRTLLERLGSPPDRANSALAAFREEMTGRSDRLSKELNEARRREAELERELASEKRRCAELAKECEKITAERRRSEEDAERRITELMAGFEEFQTTKGVFGELEETIDTLNLRLLETGQKFQAEKNRADVLAERLAEAQEALAQQLRDREALLASVDERIETLRKETLSLADTTKDSLEADLCLAREEARNSNLRLIETASRLSEIENDLTRIFNENRTLQEQLEDRNKVVAGLELDLDGLNRRFESAESERRRLQEELDTTQQTVEFHRAELRERREHAALESERLRERERQLEDISTRLSASDALVFALKAQIDEAQQEDSPFNIALRENKDLRMTQEELVHRLENIQRELALRNTNLDEMKEELEKVRESEHNFRGAYEELRTENARIVEHRSKLERTLEEKSAELSELMAEAETSRHTVQELEDKLLHADGVLRREMKLRETAEEEREELRGLLDRREEMISVLEEEKRLWTDETARMSAMRVLKEENNRLRSEVRERTEAVTSLSATVEELLKEHDTKFRDYARQFEEVQKRQQILADDARVKEAEARKREEEGRLLEVEKIRLLSDLATARSNEVALRRELDALGLEAESLAGAKKSLEKEVADLHRTNETLAGHKNHEQKIRYVSRLKEELCQTKEEKAKLVEQNTRLNQEKTSLQRQVDDLLRRSGIAPAREKETGGDYYLAVAELEKARHENKLMMDALTKVVGRRDERASKDSVEALVSLVGQAIQAFADKDRLMEQRELEMRALQIKFSLKEKELLLDKKKLEVIYANHPDLMSFRVADVTNTPQKFMMVPTPQEPRDARSSIKKKTIASQSKKKSLQKEEILILESGGTVKKRLKLE
eukprot:TRINITY_DN4423_c0_g1_i6.p1 TRINITY_DN4423_c0_g1~~TRINITY_DN4423_c0_g1_i6.p1  ORF type:complete len:902 (+),score=252.77 TRINITY_DN4423_c0_g1_i6:2401-5106(+)